MSKTTPKDYFRLVARVTLSILGRPETCQVWLHNEEEWTMLRLAISVGEPFLGKYWALANDEASRIVHAELLDPVYYAAALAEKGDPANGVD